MRDPDTTAGLPPPPDPPQVRPGRPVPEGIAEVLAIVQILLAYGRHLAATLEHRAAGPCFAVIAQFFGTARLPTIRARLARGLLRAQALQRVLLARAARGRDLVPLKPRTYAPRAAQPAGATPAEAIPQPPPARCADAPRAPDPDALPTLEQLEAEIRRRPIGRAVADICRDFGVSPSLCEGRVWLAISCTLMWYRGNLPSLMKELRRREVTFCDTEADRNPALGWPERTREGNRRVLGFFIGQPPVMPFPAPAAPALLNAAATGPP